MKIFPNKNYILDFIRGYVDGDGCLTIFPNQRKTSERTVISLVGTESFLKTINTLFGNKGYITNKSCNNWENKEQLLPPDIIRFSKEN